MVIRSFFPPAAFSNPVAETLLWTLVWVAGAGVLTVAAQGLEARAGAFEWFGRLCAAVPALLAGVALYQALGSAHAPLGWGLLALSAALAVGLALRPGVALGFNTTLLGLVVALPWLGPSEPRLEPSAKRIGAAAQLDPPRVVLITIDTLRADELGYYGGEASTPHLDQLAADSLVFEQARSSSGWTLPALSSILMGVSPWVHGAWTPGDIPAHAPLSLAERFSEAGYLTAKIGDNLFLTRAGSGPALTEGFQVNVDFPEQVRPRTSAFEFLRLRELMDLGFLTDTGRVFEWATQWVERNQEESFFLWVHVFDPHQPYLPPQDFSPESFAEGGPDPVLADPTLLPKSPEQARRMRALYRGEIAYVDDRLGAFLERLRELEIYDDSLIALVSDHGEEFFEHGGFAHGHSLFRELLHVPWIVKLPGSAQRGRIPGLVSTIRLAPTLLTLANVDYDPEDFSSGRAPLDGGLPDEPVFAAGIAKAEAQETVIFDGLKLTRHVGFGLERLYDLDADPEERINLATQRPDDVRRGVSLLQQHRTRAGELRERLGIRDKTSLEYAPAEKEMLRSLGYIQ